MNYAIIEGKRHTPQKGLRGKCIACDNEMIAKCGNIRLPHWAHKGKKHCDPWWENETEWHREWKNLFPEEWREVPCRDVTGEKHVADIKRPDGFYIEFQNSVISKEEVESRNLFYKNLVWVVNGSRSSLDLDKVKTFSKFRSKDEIIDVSKVSMRVTKKWKHLAKHIFIDFNESNSIGRKRIFYLMFEGAHEFLFEITIEDFVAFAMTKGGMKPFVQKANAAKDKIIKEENEGIRKRKEWEKRYIDPFR